MKRVVLWWNRYQSSLLLVLLILSAAGLVRASQGTGLVDLKRWLIWPFRGDGQVQQQLLDAQTQELQQRIQDLESQNRALKALLKLPLLPNVRKVSAPVLSRSADNWWQQLTLGKGRTDGIRMDAVVVAPGGLVGRVMSVTPNTCRVLLVTDPGSQIGITVSRTRQVGILRGQSNRYGVVEFFDKTPDIKIDDAVVTSQLSSRFPPGISIGRIVALQLEHLPTPAATVEFAVPIENLEWVNVLIHG
ncbi:MAG: rod shape-determining protein MreC [Thermosynechococcaceae cyanobacterium]